MQKNKETTASEQNGGSNQIDAAPAQPQPAIAEQDEARSEATAGKNTGDAGSQSEHGQCQQSGAPVSEKATHKSAADKGQGAVAGKTGECTEPDVAPVEATSVTLVTKVFSPVTFQAVDYSALNDEELHAVNLANLTEFGRLTGRLEVHAYERLLPALNASIERYKNPGCRMGGKSKVEEYLDSLGYNYDTVRKWNERFRKRLLAAAQPTKPPKPDPLTPEQKEVFAALKAQGCKPGEAKQLAKNTEGATFQERVSSALVHRSKAKLPNGEHEDRYRFAASCANELIAKVEKGEPADAEVANLKAAISIAPPTPVPFSTLESTVMLIDLITVGKRELTDALAICDQDAPEPLRRAVMSLINRFAAIEMKIKQETRYEPSCLAQAPYKLMDQPETSDPLDDASVEPKTKRARSSMPRTPKPTKEPAYGIVWDDQQPEGQQVVIRRTDNTELVWSGPGVEEAIVELSRLTGEPVLPADRGESVDPDAEPKDTTAA